MENVRIMMHVYLDAIRHHQLSSPAAASRCPVTQTLPLTSVALEMASVVAVVVVVAMAVVLALVVAVAVG